MTAFSAQIFSNRARHNDDEGEGDVDYDDDDDEEQKDLKTVLREFVLWAFVQTSTYNATSV